MKPANRAIMMVVAIAATLALVTTALVGGNPQSVMANTLEQAHMTTPTDQMVNTGPNDYPGLSVPSCQSNGIFMYWHTKSSGNASAPDGWQVERRARVNGEYTTRTWEFIGAASDNLQVYSNRYWDWTDRSRSTSVNYTYRVRAVNTDGTKMAERRWSRRAPVTC